jgi:drug/metabolite transporter (DMT)-like permease
MQAWWLPFVATAIAAVTAPLASKVAARTAGPLFASIVESAATFAVVAVVAGGALVWRGQAPPVGAWGWPAAAGALWSIFVVGIYFAFASGAPVGQAMALLRAIAIAGTTVAAVVWLGETLAPQQWLGVAFIVAGIALVSWS